MKLTLTSATAALKAVQDGLARFPLLRCLSLLFLVVACTLSQALPQANYPRTAQNKAAHSDSLPGQLELRVRALDAARNAGDPAAITAASRAVAALALRDFAELQMAQDQPAQSIETYRRAIDFEDVPGAHLDLALAYLRADHPDQALSQATDVLVADPQNARAWRVQGQVWMWKGNYGHAVESLRKSAALQPGAETTRLLRLALSRASKNREPRQSSPSGARLSELLPKPKITHVELQTRQRRLRKILGSALNDLGTAEARQQQFPLALAHFHEAEQWQSDTPGLMRNIGMAATRAGDYAEAARALRPVVAADRTDDVARSMLGMALFSTGAYGEAAATFAPLGDSVLERPELGYAWAESLVKLNRYTEAASLLDKVESRPLATSTQLLVAQAWSQMGNYPRTVAACQRVLQSDPKLAQAHHLAGLALIHEDHPADAAAEFRAELQQDPANVDAEYHLAFVQFQLSQEQEAMQHLRNVLARDPKHPDANYELGKALLRAGNTAQAIPYLEAAARLKPELDAVHYQLQSAYRSLGRKADADREANIYRAMKTKSRNITLPPPRSEPSPPPQSQ
ncbi:MAG TPA: tetratricopeptide repeat protein [Terriglobales bacterium]|nr:tetratricopeptide repeat protein [Terriglobales bacterium]